MWIQLLEDFIKDSQEQREITRAMAVKMLLFGYKHKEKCQYWVFHLASSVRGKKHF